MSKTKTICRVHCLVGDSAPLLEDKKPLCARCKGKKLTVEFEFYQHGFFEDKVLMVAKCEKCLEHTSFEYQVIFSTEE